MSTIFYITQIMKQEKEIDTTEKPKWERDEAAKKDPTLKLLAEKCYSKMAELSDGIKIYGQFLPTDEGLKDTGKRVYIRFEKGLAKIVNAAVKPTESQ